MEDICLLTKNQFENIRVAAFYTLGRASIIKASESEDMDALRTELESAVSYFAKASSQGTLRKSARFCYPFYKSYLAISQQKASEEDIKRYLVEAREAVEGSSSKEELISTVENLAEALKKARSLKDRPFKEVSDELKALKWYCDEAADHLIAVEDSAPGAVKLLRKYNPFIKERIETTIFEIQKEARDICAISRGSNTRYEIIGKEIHKQACLISIEDFQRTQNCASRIIFQLGEFCKILPEQKRKLVCSAIREIKGSESFPERLSKIELALAYALPVIKEGIPIEILIMNLKRDILLMLDKNQKEIINNIGYPIEKMDKLNLEFEEIYQQLNNLIIILDKLELHDSKLENLIQETNKVLRDPEIDLNMKLQLAIPLIMGLPFSAGIELELSRSLDAMGSLNKIKENFAKFIKKLNK